MSRSPGEVWESRLRMAKKIRFLVGRNIDCAKANHRHPCLACSRRTNRIQQLHVEIAGLPRDDGLSVSRGLEITIPNRQKSSVSS